MSLHSIFLRTEAARNYRVASAAEGLQAIQDRADLVKLLQGDNTRLAWHDVTCPEGEECRSRELHSLSDNLYNSGVLQRFLERLVA